MESGLEFTGVAFGAPPAGLIVGVLSVAGLVILPGNEGGVEPCTGTKNFPPEVGCCIRTL